MGIQFGERVQRAVVFPCEAEEGSLLHIGFEQVDGERFVVDDGACQYHDVYGYVIDTDKGTKFFRFATPADRCKFPLFRRR